MLVHKPLFQAKWFFPLELSLPHEAANRAQNDVHDFQSAGMLLNVA